MEVSKKVGYIVGGGSIHGSISNIYLHPIRRVYPWKYPKKYHSSTGEDIAIAWGWGYHLFISGFFLRLAAQVIS
jgi:hypothetical protein